MILPRLTSVLIKLFFMTTTTYKCQLCENTDLTVVSGFNAFSRITSDSKPWPKGGNIGVCKTCGCVQKILDDSWHQDVSKIYNNYTIYHMANGCEQQVFNGLKSEPRSKSILSVIDKNLHFPSHGTLLDIGCGNGGMLRSAQEILPNWILAGSEFNEKHRAQIEMIKNVKSFFTCSLDKILDTYDLVTIIHVLEHIINPRNILNQISHILNKNGFLLIEVPNLLENPFDLLIVDHVVHFTLKLLTNLLRLSGFEISFSSETAIVKEITICARLSMKVPCKQSIQYQNNLLLVENHISWLNKLVNKSRDVAQKTKPGIFGTSNAGTWLFQELFGAVSFFIDEDPNRIGTKYMGIPVLAPTTAPRGSTIIFPFPTKIANRLALKFKNDDFVLVIPDN